MEGSTTTAAGRPPRVIEASHGLGGFRLSERRRGRGLLHAATTHYVLVRFEQTVLGIGRAGLQTFFLMLVSTLFFKRLGKTSLNGIPTPYSRTWELSPGRSSRLRSPGAP